MIPTAISHVIESHAIHLAFDIGKFYYGTSGVRGHCIYQGPNSPQIMIPSPAKVNLISQSGDHG
jgi:hypothetical protein